jgi:F-type H+-transporting ATPase subunit gamma
METTEQLSRQIQTAEDLASVVRTMKTLAAVNIRQYEAAAESLVSYEQTLQSAVQMLLWNVGDDLVEPAPSASRRTGLIVLGSDQGRCGGFNDAIARFARELLADDHTYPPEVEVLVLGRRLAARLEDAGRPLDSGIDLPGAAPGITLMLQDLLPRVDRWRAEHRLDAVNVCHNRRLSQVQYEPVRRTLLPVSPRDLVPQRLRRWPRRSLPLITMPPRGLWQSIVRQHLFVLLFQACAESQASENAARIAAMQAAETHIRDRLEELGRDYQQLRQTSITAELLDIISGFEAVSTDQPVASVRTC